MPASCGGLIREHLLEILQATERAPLDVAEPPAVVMVVGVNGSGKTTTIGKLARAATRREGRSVLLCAADTFRAAAIEQLEIWGERTGDRRDPAEARRGPERGALRRAAGGAWRARRTT